MKTYGIKYIVHIKVYIHRNYTTNPLFEISRVQGPQVRNPWLEHWVWLQVSRLGGMGSERMPGREPGGKEWARSPQTILHILT